MITPCLICDSKAILTRWASMGTALLDGLVNTAIQGGLPREPSANALTRQTGAG